MQEDVKEEAVDPQEHNEPAVDPQEKNWRQVRQSLAEAKEREARHQREIEELRNLVQAVKPQEKEIDPWEGLENDDVLEVAKAKEIIARQTQAEVKRALDQALKQRDSDPVVLEQKTKAKYKDFDQVMTAENVDDIIKTNPLVHDAILKSANPIEAAYQFISGSAKYHNRTLETKGMIEKAKLKDNQSKPKSPNSLASSHAVASPGQFSRLTKEQQKELWTDHNRRLGRRV